ncbi:hypothetical protein [Streptomyces sp. NPDC020965]|uniref:hypothetical protein n=1 Tax=Streptomyces sp. NPDC020965 TaxID=3365105 RepID=UPI0037A226BE
MRELRDGLARALDDAGPTAPDEVFAALCAHLTERRGRPVVLHLVDFPPGTASGLYLDMTDRDVICVQAGTQPLHQLIIFGHEVWHMIAGHGGLPEPLPTADPATGPAAAARLAADDAGLDSAVQNVAARTDFRQSQETEAETFGLELGTHLRRWLDGTAEPAGTSAVARRIQASLGHRQG